MRANAQAGLEYLMTYGWAIVLVASVIGAMVFLVNPPRNEAVFVSSSPAKMLVIAGTTSNGAAEIRLRNLTGGKIKLIAVDISCVASGCTLNGVPLSSLPIDILQGGEIAIAGIANLGQGGVAISYTDYAGIQRNVNVQAEGGSCSSDSDCDDGLYCNGQEYCSNSECAAGTPVSCGIGQACDEETDSCVLDAELDCTGKGEGDACLSTGTCDSEGRCLGPELLQNPGLDTTESWPIDPGPPSNPYAGSCDIGTGAAAGMMSCTMLPGTSFCGPAAFGQILPEAQSGSYLVAIDVGYSHRTGELGVTVLYSETLHRNLTFEEKLPFTSTTFTVSDPAKIAVVLHGPNQPSLCQLGDPPIVIVFEGISLRKILG